jgi:hypothetical protein
MPAGQAQSQVNPSVAHLQALFAALPAGLDFMDLIEVRAGFAHGDLSVSLPPLYHFESIWLAPLPTCPAPGAKNRAIGLTARALALYHDFDALHVLQESEDPRHSLPLLCARRRVGVASLDFANAGNRAHRQTLTVGFLFSAANGLGLY